MRWFLVPATSDSTFGKSRLNAELRTLETIFEWASNNLRFVHSATRQFLSGLGSRPNSSRRRSRTSACSSPTKVSNDESFSGGASVELTGNSSSVFFYWIFVVHSFWFSNIFIYKKAFLMEAGIKASDRHTSLSRALSSRAQREVPKDKLHW